MKSKSTANRALVAEKSKLTKLFTLLTILTLGITNVWAEDFTITPITGSYLSPGNLVKITYTGDLKTSSTQIQTTDKNKSGVITLTAIAPGVYLKSASFTDANWSTATKRATLECTSGGSIVGVDGVYTFTASDNATTATISVTAGTSGAAKLGSVSLVVTNGTTNDIETYSTFAKTGNDFSFTAQCNGASITPAAALSSSTWTVSSNNISAPSSNDSKTITISSDNNIKFIALYDSNCRLSLVEKSSSGGTCDGASWSVGSTPTKSVTFKNGIGTSLTITKVFVITEAASKHSVTYNLNGGTGTTPTQADVAEGAKFTLHDGTTGITPPSGQEFSKWNDGTNDYDGGEEYTMGTTDVTLTAQWVAAATTYDITFNNGGHGTAPSAINNSKVTLEELSAAGYVHKGWIANQAVVVDESPVSAGTLIANGKTAHVSANTEFTAQWMAVWTVTYYDGATPLGSEVVENGSSPVEYAAKQTKALASFVNWYTDPDLADGHLIPDISVLTITANTPVYGKWNKAYAESIDFITVAGDYVAQLAAKNYALNCADMTKVSYDNNSNLYDKGLKIKKNGTTLSWNVEADKVVEVTTGIISGATLSVNGGAAENLTITTKSDASIKTRAYYSAGEQSFVIATTTDSYCIFKSISIHDPYVVTYDATTNGGEAVDPGTATYTGTALTLPAAVKGTENFIGWYDDPTAGTKIGDANDEYTPSATITLYAHFESISTDARLASITFSSDAGTLSPAFNPEVVNYTYTMPYGTAAVPTITGATAVNANAKAPVIDAQAAAWGDVAQIHGVAESDDTKDYYITMKIAPKDGACLVWADIPSNNTITYNATNSKYFAESDVTLATTVNGKDGAAPSGVKFQNNNYIHIGGAFLAGDILALDVTYGTANKMYVYKAQDAAAEDVIGELDGTTTPTGLVKVTLTENATDLWLVRGGISGSWNPHVDYVAVYRIMNPLLKAITINGEAGVIDESLKTVTVELQPGYDLAALTIDPTIVSNTDEALVVKTVTSNGGAWVLGPNTYRLTDKDGDYTEYTITLTAGALKHNVTFNTHGGSAVAGVEVVDGEYLTAGQVPANPTKEDYIFQYWSEAEDGSEVDITTVQINADKEFHAVWASDGAIKLLDGSTVNHTNFITGVTASTVEIESVNYNCVATAGNTSAVNNSNTKNHDRVIAYNATTTQTKIQLSLYNSNGNARSIEVKGVVEGTTDIVDIATVNLTGNEKKVTEYFEFNNAKNRTIYIYTTSNAGHIKILQVKVLETGTVLPMAGDAGYSFNLNKGRLFGKQLDAFNFEGLDIEYLAADYTPLSSTVGRFALNTSISFTVASNVTMSLTAANNKTYYVTKDAAGTDNETSVAGVSEFALTAGTWYITADASEVQFTNIAFSAPKCEAPVFNGALADIELCAGDPFSTAFDGTATVGDGGTVTYKWYAEGADETDPAAVLGTNATYTPNAEGNYYVIATNSLSGFADNSTKSALVNITQFAAAVITAAPENQRDNVGETVTLSVTASGKNLSYEWFTCDDELGTNPVAIVPAETNASLSVTVAAGTQWYKVVVSSDCGNAEAVAKVSEFTAATPQDVTATTTWDWTTDAWPASGTIEFANQTDEQLLADVDAAVPNNAAFHSDMLYGIGQYVWRSGNKFFQGKQIRFNNTVAGRVRVHFRSTGGGKNVQVTINGTVAGSGDAWQWTNYVYVPAGGVTIVCAGMTGNETGLTRIDKIEFQTPDYTRTEMLGNGVLGTLCVDHNVPVEGIQGATFYELAGKNAEGKIAFDQITTGQLDAGVPYVFQAHGDNLALYYGSETEAAPVDKHNGMYGTFSQLVLSGSDLNDVYYFAQKALWSCTDLIANSQSLTIPANRAYVKLSEIPDVPSASPAPGRIRMTLNVNGAPQVATGMEEITNDQSQMTNKVIIDGRLYILRGEKLYDATGRLVK